MSINSEKCRTGAIQWFNDRSEEDVFYNVALGIVNMGKAADMRGQIPAMVAVNKKDDTCNFQLSLNSTIFQDFTEEESAGVVWHELNHIIHKHLAYHLGEDTMPNKKCRTIAEEIVCNDTVLLHDVVLPMMSPDSLEGIYYGEKWLGYNTQENSMSTQDVYDELMEKGKEVSESRNSQDNTDTSGRQSSEESSRDSNSDSNDQYDSADEKDNSKKDTGTSGNTDDNTSASKKDDAHKEDTDNQLEDDTTTDDTSTSDQGNNSLQEGIDNALADMYDEVDDNTDGCMDTIVIDPNVLPEELLDKLDEILEDVSLDNEDSAKKGHGIKVTINSGLPDVTNNTSEMLELSKLLMKINPMLADKMPGNIGLSMYRNDWSKTPRYSYSLPPADTPIIPLSVPDRNNTMGNDATTHVIFAVDCSGSIPPHVRDYARKLTMNIPRDVVDARIVYFADHTQEIDKETGEFIETNDNGGHGVGYGTDFTSIHRWATRNIEKDNYCIVVLTDGYSNFDSNYDIDPEKWLWIDVENNNFSDACDTMRDKYFTEDKVFNLEDLIS